MTLDLKKTYDAIVVGSVAAERVQVTGRQLFALAQAPTEYKLRFFNGEQNALLDRLDRIDHSGR